MIGVPEMSTGDILLMWLDQQFSSKLCQNATNIIYVEKKNLEVLFYGIFNDN